MLRIIITSWAIAMLATAAFPARAESFFTKPCLTGVAPDGTPVTGADQIHSCSLAIEDSRVVVQDPAIWPRDLIVLYKKRGELHYFQQEGAEAEADFDAAISLAAHLDDPRDPLLASAYGFRGLVRQERGAFAQARADLDEAVAIAPRNAVILKLRGSFLADQARNPADTEAAIADYDAAIAINPEDAVTRLLRALAHTGLGHSEQAIADYDAAIRLDPNLALAYGGRCLERALLGKDLATARTDCDRALQLAPDDLFVVDSHGFISLRQGRWQEAWNDYDAVLRADPQSAKALFGRGIAALRLGRSSDGQADIARAASIDDQVVTYFKNFGVSP
ncbi:MAG: tetratricopeptide repeat protein [Porphyrobacter sp.]|nr:tetratricopeptide repeat protein [Porphyrobacter sp.]